MKIVKLQNLEELELSIKKVWKIEEKILKTTEPLSDGEANFLKDYASSGSPRGEFIYGLYLLLHQNNESEAEVWWNKFFYHSNGFALWRASGIFAYLGDEYYEWSMRCLRRSAWRQFPIAKRMLKEMKEHPFKFPEA